MTEEKDNNKVFHRDCKFFVVFNHTPCCLWPAIIIPEKSPDELVKGCPENCIMNPERKLKIN